MTSPAQPVMSLAPDEAFELCAANRALACIIEQLASVDRLETFLQTVLVEAVSACGAKSGAVFLHEKESGRLRQVAKVIDGATLDPWDESQPTFVAPIEADGFPPWQFFQGTGELLWFDYESDERHPFDWQGARQFHRALGHRFVIEVPMVRDSVLIGFLAMAWDRSLTVQPSATRLALCRALTQKAGIAVRLMQLTEEGRRLELQRDREAHARRRAEEHSRATAALSEALAQLSSDDALDQFLVTLLREALASSGAVSGTIFLIDHEEVELVQRALVVRGQCVDPRSPANALFNAPICRDNDEFWNSFIGDSEVRWVDFDDVDAPRWNNAREFHHREAHRFVAVIPLRRSREVLGLMGIAWDREVDQQPSSDRIEMALVLSRQATLAVHLTRLSEEARNAEQLRWQTRASEQRMAGLVQLNALLRRTIPSNPGELRSADFLGSQLREAARLAGAETALLLLYSPGGDALQFHRAICDGVDVDPHSDQRFAIWQKDFPIAETCLAGIEGDLVAEFTSDFAADQEAGIADNSAVLRFHRMLGHRHARTIPLHVGDQVVALLGLCFTTDTRPNEEAVEVVRILAQQISLALEMDRLSRQERTAAVAEERNRLARDIHDSLAQGFTGVIMQLEAAKRLFSGDINPAVREHLDRAAELARSSLAEARASVHALRPPSLVNQSLVTALEALLLQITRDGSTRPRFEQVGVLPPLSSHLEENILRIVQEAAVNAVKHATASQFLCSIWSGAGRLVLTLTDDGRGFDPAAERAGFGLRSIQERVELLGGKCAIVSAANAGTTITAEFVLPRSG